MGKKGFRYTVKEKLFYIGSVSQLTLKPIENVLINMDLPVTLKSM